MLVSMMAGPRFLSQLTTRTSVRCRRFVMALTWYGRRFGVLYLCFFRDCRMVRRKVDSRVRISSGMSHSFGSQVEGKCIEGMKTSSLSCGRPEK